MRRSAVRSIAWLDVSRLPEQLTNKIFRVIDGAHLLPERFYQIIPLILKLLEISRDAARNLGVLLMVIEVLFNHSVCEVVSRLHALPKSNHQGFVVSVPLEHRDQPLQRGVLILCTRIMKWDPLL